MPLEVIHGFSGILLKEIEHFILLEQLSNLPSQVELFKLIKKLNVSNPYDNPFNPKNYNGFEKLHQSNFRI